MSAEPEAVDSVGQVVSYRYVVENARAVPLDGPAEVSDDTTVVVCPPLATVGDGDDVLDPGESVTCEAAYAVTDDDLGAGSITTIAQATVGGSIPSRRPSRSPSRRSTPIDTPSSTWARWAATEQQPRR